MNVQENSQAFTSGNPGTQKEADRFVAACREAIRRAIPHRFDELFSKLDDALYERLAALSARLDAALRPAVEGAGQSMSRVGSMFTVFFRPEPPSDFEEVKECDLDAFGRFHREALNRGVYLPPSQFEAAFLPAVLTDAQVDHIAAALADALHKALAVVDASGSR